MLVPSNATITVAASGAIDWTFAWASDTDVPYWGHGNDSGTFDAVAVGETDSYGLIKSAALCNTGTAEVTVSVYSKYDSTSYEMVTVSLAPGESLTYGDGYGWRVFRHEKSSSILTTASGTVDDSPTVELFSSASATRTHILISNTGSEPLFVGFTNDVSSTKRAFKLKADETLLVSAEPSTDVWIASTVTSTTYTAHEMRILE